MPKADKETCRRRVRDVAGLLVLGADFTTIWKFATTKGWSVSERQVRRYIQKAHGDLAKNTEQDRRQIRGRIIAQLRMLFARSVKDNDFRGAKQVLREEALLHGLYPSKSGPVTGGEVRSSGTERSVSMKLMQRVSRLLAAQVRDDAGEVQLLEEAMPRRFYCVPDTMVPLWSLHILSMAHIIEQLEQVATLMYALCCATLDDEADGSWNLLAQFSAYRFSIGRDGWNQFARTAGVDGNYLVSCNYQGAILELCQDAIHKLAPTGEVLASEMTKAGFAASPVLSGNDLAKSWQRLLTTIVSD